MPTPVEMIRELNPYESPNAGDPLCSSNTTSRRRRSLLRIIALGIGGYGVFAVIARLLVSANEGRAVEWGGGIAAAVVFASSELLYVPRSTQCDIVRRLIASGVCMITVIVLAGVVERVYGLAAPRYEQENRYFRICCVLAAAHFGAMLLLRIALVAYLDKKQGIDPRADDGAPRGDYVSKF